MSTIVPFPPRPASTGPDRAQALAADPAINAFVTANAGSGKTKTLIDRVARLLLAGAPAGAILCVTYTKAAAAEMQARLFKVLGDWSVTPDETLARALADLLGDQSTGIDLTEARRLFARALETPGGLKIQTIHAFCEQLLRRFPLEAGVSPRFTVMDDAAAALVAREARELLAGPMIEASPPLADAYARMAVRLDQRAFEGMFGAFAAQRESLAAYVESLGGFEALPADVWARCGFAGPVQPTEIERQAAAGFDRNLWRTAVDVLSGGSATDQKTAAAMGAVLEQSQPLLSDLTAIFFTKAGTPGTWIGRAAVLKAQETLRDGLLAEQERLAIARERVRAARVAEETVTVLTLAFAYAQAYRAAKAARGVLDFTDLTARARDLVASAPGAPWVLYKLDGGLEHVLIDEAQDTAPEQWAIARALTDEFFTGAGRDRPAGSPDRTVFVVGDEKQSIYSFQGADPDRLKIETDHYIATIRAADRIAELAPLKTSYRSVRPVLEFVDALFGLDRTRSGVRPPEGETVLEHIAFRDQDAGCVDLWPLEEEPETTGREAWDAPLDAESETSANRRLAERIAQEIRRLHAAGEQVFDKEAKSWRPARWGDVIILVRRRKALFEDIIRALRKVNVPVAGADRLSLSEHIAFDDLMALARFVRFPGDDLTLAALLKSPLCGLVDEDIYSLAHRRGNETLWARLTQSEAPVVVAARQWLRTALELARDRPPFEFFSRILGLEDEAGQTGRARMVTRMGSEAGDVIEEFLARALEAEGRGVVDLEGLCAAFAELDISVKREMEGGADEVRVMTAHGAKGLEAPIVFLPETTLQTTARGSPLMADGQGGWLWSARTDDDCDASAAARQRRKDREEGESWRLLYVALTRARDRLVLCGRRPRMKAGAQPPGWYGAMQETFDSLDAAGLVRTVEGPGNMLVRRFGADPKAGGIQRAATAPACAAPAWAGRDPPPETAASWVSPSQAVARVRTAAPSPLARQAGLDRFRRGDVIHRLLQLLPDAAPAERRAAAARLLSREVDLTDAQRAEMTEAAFGVLDHPDFAEVFGPGSRAEVAMAGTSPELPQGLGVSGRVDRLVVTPRAVLVVDYKTNRPAPASIEAADGAYIAQMAVYWAVLKAIFPGRQVRAALVWTDGPRLMPVPEKMMAAALAALPGAR